MKIKTKILLLTISTLISIMVLSTYYTHRVLEKNHETALREDASKIARQIESYVPPGGEAAKSVDMQELDAHFNELLFLSSHVARVDTYIFNPDGALSPFISKEKIPTAPAVLTPQDIERVRGGELLVGYEETGGKNYARFIAPLRANGSVFGLAEFKVSHEEFHNLVANKRKATLVVAVLSLAAIAGVLIVSMDWLVNKPIQNLLEAIGRVKKGDLNVSVEPAAGDEIGRLTGHFNEMVSTIRKDAEEKEALLEQINRHNDELQQRIRLATEELLERNEALKVANQSVYDIQKKLGRSRRLAAVGQLAATVAHELGTPLHSVSGHLQLLMEEPNLSGDITRRLTIMQSQLERITDSIQNLLDTTRPPDINYDLLDINATLEDIVILVMPETVSKQITVLKSFQKGLPPIYGSRSRVQAVFLNIVDNAIDACYESGTIRISTSLVDKEEKGLPAEDLSRGPWIKITVSDNGRGITENYMKHIFEPFYTTKARGQGTGLGLAISQEIVNNHHGHITVESKVDEGSVFTVYFPAAVVRS